MRSEVNLWVGEWHHDILEVLGPQDLYSGQRTRPASQRCAYGRVFYAWVSALPRIPFNKPPLSIAGQLALLGGRGLTVNDAADATHYLTHIGYYRLSGYALRFQIGGAGPNRHSFKPGVTFCDSAVVAR
jgi:hypothetical protein